MTPATEGAVQIPARRSHRVGVTADLRVGGTIRLIAVCEHWIGSLRRECLDRILTVHRGQPEGVLREYVLHHNAHRPHRSLGLRAPEAAPTPLLPTRASPRDVRRRDRLGGLLREYELAA